MKHYTRAFIWDDGEAVSLPAIPAGVTSLGFAINDDGQVVGYGLIEVPELTTHGFIWSDGQMTDLNDLISPPFQVYRAWAINNSGQITGQGGVGTGTMAVLLTPVESPVGDINGDCQVGIVDFLLLLSNWGLCPPQGACVEDLDGDGVVGIIDFLLLLTNWSA